MEGDNLANCDIDTGIVMFEFLIIIYFDLVTSSVIIQSMSGHVITFFAVDCCIINCQS